MEKFLLFLLPIILPTTLRIMGFIFELNGTLRASIHLLHLPWEVSERLSGLAKDNQVESRDQNLSL